MSELLAPVVLCLIILAPIAAFVWQLRRVRRGEVGKLVGLARFFSFAILPVLVYGAGFAALAGIEELGGQSLIGEGFARTLIPVIVIGLGEVLLLSVVFAFTITFVKPSSEVL